MNTSKRSIRYRVLQVSTMLLLACVLLVGCTHGPRHVFTQIRDGSKSLVTRLSGQDDERATDQEIAQPGRASVKPDRRPAQRQGAGDRAMVARSGGSQTKKTQTTEPQTNQSSKQPGSDVAERGRVFEAFIRKHPDRQAVKDPFLAEVTGKPAQADTPADKQAAPEAVASLGESATVASLGDAVQPRPQPAAETTRPRDRRDLQERDRRDLQERDRRDLQEIVAEANQSFGAPHAARDSRQARQASPNFTPASDFVLHLGPAAEVKRTSQSAGASSQAGSVQEGERHRTPSPSKVAASPVNQEMIVDTAMLPPRSERRSILPREEGRTLPRRALPDVVPDRHVADRSRVISADAKQSSGQREFVGHAAQSPNSVADEVTVAGSRSAANSGRTLSQHTAQSADAGDSSLSGPKLLAPKPGTEAPQPLPNFDDSTRTLPGHSPDADDSEEAWHVVEGSPPSLSSTNWDGERGAATQERSFFSAGTLLLILLVAAAMAAAWAVGRKVRIQESEV